MISVTVPQTPPPIHTFRCKSTEWVQHEALGPCMSKDGYAHVLNHLYMTIACHDFKRLSLLPIGLAYASPLGSLLMALSLTAPSVGVFSSLTLPVGIPGQELCKNVWPLWVQNCILMCRGPGLTLVKDSSRFQLPVSSHSFPQPAPQATHFIVRPTLLGFPVVSPLSPQPIWK